MAVAARDGQVWLAFREYDLADGSFDTLAISHLHSGGWSHETLGVIGASADPLLASQGQVQFATRMGDARIHVYTR